MNELPSWVQVLQALLTPAIAAAVAVIGFLQWRTAHAKIVLDLFDRRWRAFQVVSDFYLMIVRQGVNLNDEEIARFHKVRAEVAFLFGNEVQAFVGELHLSAIKILTHSSSATDAEPEVRRKHVRAAFEEVKAAFSQGQRLEAVFLPYLKMDQKRVRTPAEWLRDRNEFRKSFDDQK